MQSLTSGFYLELQPRYIAKKMVFNINNRFYSDEFYFNCTFDLLNIELFSGIFVEYLICLL